MPNTSMKRKVIISFFIVLGSVMYSYSGNITSSETGTKLNAKDQAMASFRQISDDNNKVTIYKPEPVVKKSKAKVYVHMMPWFETRETNDQPEHMGEWGIHYTMSNKNPDKIVDSLTGRREVAMYYYPLTGPYASGDLVIIEYQLLLMKLSGIDGVFIDWPPIINTNDYPLLVRNTEKIVSQLEKVGLQFAIVYEDQDINIAFKKNAIDNKIEAAQKDMEYLNTRYFSKPNYVKLNGKPLLLDFGPQTFETEAEWTQIFSKLGENKPAFYTLWYESKDAGANADGEFAWVWQKNYEDLDKFYNNHPLNGGKIASAYPGFVSYYAEGGWGNIPWTIPHRGDTTFTQTLKMALDSKLDIIQLVTWNDYGEGTMIEPTVEFGYSFLDVLQKSLGVSYNQSDLEMIYKLYFCRRKFAGSEKNQKKLDQVFYYIVSLNIDKARNLLDSIH
jgi:hypothetical protein